MNNDPALSSAANQPLTHGNGDDAGHESATNQTPADGGTYQPPSSSESSLKRKSGLAKLHIMTHLMRNLDMVVFAEICTLYYME